MTIPTAASTTSPRRMLTVQQAADQIGIHRSTLYRWIAEGAIPAFKRSSTIRIRQQALDEFIDQHPWRDE